jgi:hypothetical protein
MRSLNPYCETPLEAIHSKLVGMCQSRHNVAAAATPLRRRRACWYVRPVRTTFEFDFVTTATPDQVIELMTDFSPNRPRRWPASSVKAFEVYHLGETEADIREGQDFPKLWATWHYDWSTPGSVTLTVKESDGLEAGSFMTLMATPGANGGSIVQHVSLPSTTLCIWSPDGL